MNLKGEIASSELKEDEKVMVENLKKKSTRRTKAVNIVGYSFIMPSFLGFVVFVLLPIVWAMMISFQTYNIFTGQTEFAGVKNYLALFKDKSVLKVLGNTIWYAVFCTFFNTVVGLLMAVIVNDKLGRKLSVFFRSIYFFPSLVGLTFVAVIWQVFFQTDSGVINYYLGLVGVDKLPWLGNSFLAKIAVLILDVWKNCGMSMVLLLAGLQNVDKNIFEAASVDGVNGVQRFLRITLPLLSPQLLFVLIMHMTGALRIYESVYVLTGGGPGNATKSLVQLIAEKAFTSLNYGQASSLSVMLLMLIGIATIIQFIASKWWVNYD